MGSIEGGISTGNDEDEDAVVKRMNRKRPRRWITRSSYAFEFQVVALAKSSAGEYLDGLYCRQDQGVDVGAQGQFRNCWW